MSYFNDTHMSEIEFSAYVKAVCPVNGLNYDAYITVNVTKPEYIPEYSNVVKFVKSHEGTQRRPDCLVANLFDWMINQVKSCEHIRVMCNTWDDVNPKNIFIREEDFNLKTVM